MIKKVTQYLPVFLLVLFLGALSILFFFQQETHVSIATVSSGSGDRNTTADTAAIIDGKININAADLDTLCLLQGIGSSLAQRIIDCREDNGPFRSKNDLLDISGIGQTTLAHIRDYITVGEYI